MGKVHVITQRDREFSFRPVIASYNLSWNSDDSKTRNDNLRDSLQLLAG